MSDKSSEIKFFVELDKNNVPEKIMWEATDGPADRLQETKAISVCLWDHVQLNTMRIDLWTKEMNVYDMKRFYIEALDGMAEGIQNSTGDDKMANEIRVLCKKLVKHVEETNK